MEVIGRRGVETVNYVLNKSINHYALFNKLYLANNKATAMGYSAEGFLTGTTLERSFFDIISNRETCAVIIDDGTGNYVVSNVCGIMVTDLKHQEEEHFKQQINVSFKEGYTPDNLFEENRNYILGIENVLTKHSIKYNRKRLAWSERLGIEELRVKIEREGVGRLEFAISTQRMVAILHDSYLVIHDSSRIVEHYDLVDMVGMWTGIPRDVLREVI